MTNLLPLTPVNSTHSPPAQQTISSSAQMFPSSSVHILIPFTISSVIFYHLIWLRLLHRHFPQVMYRLSILPNINFDNLSILTFSFSRLVPVQVRFLLLPLLPLPLSCLSTSTGGTEPFVCIPLSKPIAYTHHRFGKFPNHLLSLLLRKENLSRFGDILDSFFHLVILMVLGKSMCPSLSEIIDEGEYLLCTIIESLSRYLVLYHVFFQVLQVYLIQKVNENLILDMDY